jgi:hypothetical protein
MKDLAYQKNKQTNEFKGDFTQNGKSVGQVDKDAFTPPPDTPPEQADVEEDFEMLGEPHELLLHLYGPGLPADVIMSSVTGSLLAKLDREIQIAKIDKIALQGDTEALKSLQQKIDSLNKIQTATIKVNQNAGTLGPDSWLQTAWSHVI